MGHVSEAELLARLGQVTVKPGERYAHYSDPEKLYEILAVGLDEETEQPCIVYRALYGANIVWTRLFEVWNRPAEVDGRTVQRFQKVA
jgi:hypothetical protein